MKIQHTKYPFQRWLIRHLTLTLIVLAWLPGISQDTILSWRFANPSLMMGDTSIFSFDIEIRTNSAEVFHRDLQVYFSYEPNVFGSDIHGNQRISIEKLAVMNGELSLGNLKYRWVNDNDSTGPGADNGPAVFALLSEAVVESNPSAAFHHALTIEWQGFARIHILVDNPGMAGISFMPEHMNKGQYYFSESGSPISFPDVVAYENDLLELEIQDCNLPQQLHADNISGNTALLQWEANGNEAGWNLLWGEAGFNFPMHGTEVLNLVENHYQLSGLAISAGYEFYVQVICDLGASLWQGPVSFTTLSTQDMVTVENIIVYGGSEECFAAVQTLVVAGNGSYFVIDDYALAELLASQNILLLPGFHAKQGSLAQVRIDQDSVYCHQEASLLASLVPSGSPENRLYVSHKKPDGIILYPNPAGDQVNIILPVHIILPLQIEIISLYGNLTSRYVLGNQHETILDISHLPPGTYFIRFENRKTESVHRLIKF